MPTTLLTIGPTHSLSNNVVYALPAKQVVATYSGSIETSIDGSAWNSVGASPELLSGKLIRSAAGSTITLTPARASDGGGGGGSGTPGGSDKQIQFNDGGAFGGDSQLTYDKNTDTLAVTGSIYLNDTSNANSTLGLTINQGGNDDNVLTFKSTDLTQPYTFEEADTFAHFRKTVAATGGLRISTFTDTGTLGGSFQVDAFSASNLDTTKSAAARGNIELLTRISDGGTSWAPANANGNLLVVCSSSVAVRFILDAEGDSHQDVGTAWTNFDSENDIEVLNILAAHVMRPDDPIKEQFGKWLEQSRDILERLRLVTFNDDGHHFVNMSRLTMLLVGAMRQTGARIAALESKLAALIEVQRLGGQDGRSIDVSILRTAE